MNLTVNFVWLGQGKLGWLECFIVYSWRMWGAKVNIFTQYPDDNLIHDHGSLGIPPNIVTVYDLPTLVASSDRDMPGTRAVLANWFAKSTPHDTDGRRQFIFNKVDLCKSFLAATQPGIVMDLKIGPSPHIHRFVAKGVFSSRFIGCKRVGTIENQLMGSMSDDDTLRAQYGRAFENDLFTKCKLQDLTSSPSEKWYSYATIAHGRAMGNKLSSLKDSLKGNWFDVSKYGTSQHEAIGVYNTEFKGIGGEKEAGAVRIFKLEADQTNKIGAPRTSDEQRVGIQDEAFWEMAQASLGDGSPVDVTAEGMPVKDLLDLLSLTKKR